MYKNREELNSFLKKYFVLEQVEDDTNIFEMGFVNSLFSMQLLVFLENEFSVTVEVEDMDMDNFSTIGNILAFIERKTNGA